MKPSLSPVGNLGAAVLLAGALHAADDLLIVDFEGDTYGAWITAGDGCPVAARGGFCPEPSAAAT